MSRLAFLSGFLQVVAGFHAGVGVYLVPPVAGKTGYAVVAGVAAFVWGQWTEPAAGVRALLARVYLLPVAAAASAYVGFCLPSTWEAVTFWGECFASEVLGRTPRAAYLMAAAYGCFRAQQARDVAATRPPHPLLPR